jgi:group I intron endonuclease
MSDVAYLYQIVNAIDGLQYIGVTKNPKVRFRSHAFHNTKTRSFLKNAIKKYGVDSFKMNILLIGTQKYCYEMEAKVIAAYNTKSPNGYNICSGGIGAVGLNGEANGMYGRTGELHPNFGKPGYNLGKKMSEETKEKMRQAHLGKKLSQETREKLKKNALNRTPDILQHIKDARLAALVNKKGIMQ